MRLAPAPSTGFVDCLYYVAWLYFLGDFFVVRALGRGAGRLETPLPSVLSSIAASSIISSFHKPDGTNPLTYSVF